MTNLIQKTNGPAKITMRVETCDCGCEGRDPWHAKTIRRVVREIGEWAKHRERDNTLVEIRRGTITVPWGEETVAQFRHSIAGRDPTCSGNWTRVSF